MQGITDVGRASTPAALPSAVSRLERARRLCRHAGTDFGIKALSIASFLLLWTLLSALTDPTFLPDPWQVVQRFSRLATQEGFFLQAAYTVLRVLAGFAVALVIGAIAGVAMGIRQRAEGFLELYVLVGLSIPGLAWAVLALMWFGISEVAPIFAIVMVVAPMLAVNMWQGTKAIDKQLLDMAAAFRASRALILQAVVIPQLLPYILAASRFGFGLGWKVVVLSEMFGLSNGIGYMINRSFAKFSMVDVLAWTLGFTAIIIVFEFGLLRPLERRLLRWRPSVSL